MRLSPILLDPVPPNHRFKPRAFLNFGHSLMATLLLLGLLCNASTAAAGPSDKPSPSSADAFHHVKPSDTDLKRLAPLMVSAARFKAMARTDFEKALLVFTRDNGRQKMWAIDKGLWTLEQSQWAWMNFFGAAVQVLGGRQGDFGLVGYYNPYCDAFLVTVWQPGPEIHQIVDAEMLMGDWVRNDNDELDPQPLWLRDKVHRPLALGLATAESLLAFERVFASASRDNWRTTLPVLTNEDALFELNYPGLVLMLNQQLISIGELIVSQNPALQTCRDLAAKVVSQASEGIIAQSLSMAVDTLPETVEALTSIPPAWFNSLKATGVRTAADGVMVFLSPTERTNASLCLFFKGEAKGYSLRRIDLVDYQTFYNGLKFQRHEAAKGGRS